MKNNDIRNIDKKIKFTTGRCGLGNLSDIAPIRITVPIVVTISKKPLGSCFGISSSLPSMVRNFPSVKVTLEKYLTVSGTPIRVVQAQMKPRVGYSFPNLRVINDPRTIPTPNMRFQKLDLFIRESQKVLLGCLVKLIAGQFNNLAQHCIFEFIQKYKASVANDKIPQNYSLR